MPLRTTPARMTATTRTRRSSCSPVRGCRSAGATTCRSWTSPRPSSPCSACRGSQASRPRVFVLGLDGTPHSYLKAETSAGRLPNLAALFEEGASVPMRSSLPSVSGTAWMTVLTGRDPGGHGIYGFMDCRPDSRAFYFPNYDHVRAPVLWDLLARAGKRSVALNVPGTYPARAMQGSLVAGFVAPQLERAVYPPSLLPRLRALGYRIDLDTRAASAGPLPALPRRAGRLRRLAGRAASRGHRAAGHVRPRLHQRAGRRVHQRLAGRAKGHVRDQPAFHRLLARPRPLLRQPRRRPAWRRRPAR